MKGYHKYLLAFAALFIFQPTALAWNTYSNLAVTLAKDELYPLLIEHHVCENIHQCRSPRRLSAGGTHNQASFAVYRSGDLSPEAIQDIMKLCLDTYILHAGKQSITLKFFRETSEEVNALFSHIKPFIYLELKGGN